MPSSIRYPDSLRQQVIALSRKGKGYKAISTELELPRDTVRNWITAYRRTGRTESVQSTGQFRDNPSFLKREERFAPARKEYETTDASLLSIAKKYGHPYNNLRNHLQQYHPESALLHSYVKCSAVIRKEMQQQITSLQETGEAILSQMKEELETQLSRLQR
ncbi:MAG: helix-turn-helix domain-containing protein [Bacteroidales bacterium]|nr:helix-turn-helix domain-containing protein [Bacteroidales bacterium]